MTQSGDPLENAVAERANGILKTEWLYRMTIPTRKACKKELARTMLRYAIEKMPEKERLEWMSTPTNHFET